MSALIMLWSLAWPVGSVFAAGATATDEAAFGLRKAGAAANLSQQSVEAAASSLPATIGLIINIFLGVVGVIILFYTVYAGYLWLTAQGNEEHVTRAKEMLKNVVVGAVITFAAYAISSFVITRILASTSIPSGGSSDVSGGAPPGSAPSDICTPTAADPCACDPNPYCCSHPTDASCH